MVGANELELGKRGGVLYVNREGLFFKLCEEKGAGGACVELLRKERESVKILGGEGAVLEIGGGVGPELYKVLGGKYGWGSLQKGGRGLGWGTLDSNGGVYKEFAENMGGF